MLRHLESGVLALHCPHCCDVGAMGVGCRVPVEGYGSTITLGRRGWNLLLCSPVYGIEHMQFRKARRSSSMSCAQDAMDAS